ncbi:hypothetical protein GY45DRAFT_1317391 [Cubamyces sp. BRFM 1775]|nr:hypothetical protein GY45DRAFT_1317391 [Cubamyces sp. BRFM 1775]
MGQYWTLWHVDRREGFEDLQGRLGEWLLESDHSDLLEQLVYEVQLPRDYNKWLKEGKRAAQRCPLFKYPQRVVCDDLRPTRRKRHQRAPLCHYLQRPPCVSKAAPPQGHKPCDDDFDQLGRLSLDMPRGTHGWRREYTGRNADCRRAREDGRRTHCGWYKRA